MEFVLLGALVFYLIPWMLSEAREHHRASTILLLNFFLGWTVLGWLAALAWASTAPKPPRHGQLELVWSRSDDDEPGPRAQSG